MSTAFDQALLERLQEIIADTHTETLQQHLRSLADTLQVQPLSLAAALLQLDPTTFAEYQSKLLHTTVITSPHIAPNKPIPTEDKTKMVRYRLEIGRTHQVSHEEIKNVLIMESGVDRSSIGYMDIRNDYTLIDLPPGMPPDIFQLLQTIEIKQQQLQIKRVNTSRKRAWQRRKNHSGNKANKPTTESNLDR